VVAGDLLDEPDPPTAILATSDAIAAGVLAAAADRGVDVPGELSVVGFDDSALARATDPPLTTVAQPQRTKGLEAARLLIRGIAGDEGLAPDQRIILPHELVVRGTTAPPLAGA
jgi:DNA-binding LacI/PurR family transcriptional regulator